MAHDLAPAVEIAAKALCRRKRAECVCHRFPDKCCAIERYAGKAAIVVNALNREGMIRTGDYSARPAIASSEAWADIRDMV